MGISGSEFEKTLMEAQEETETSQEQIRNTQYSLEGNQENYSLKAIIESQGAISPQPLTDEYIEKRVNEVIDGKPEWDDRIAYLVVPLFKRSAIMYNWNRDQFNERLNQVRLTVNRIGFTELEESNLGDTAGDHINLNSGTYIGSNGKLKSVPAPTLFHECGHRTDETIREGHFFRKQPGESIVGIFYEWLNTLSDRAVCFGEMYKDTSSLLITDGAYIQVQNLGSMVSAAMGIPEIEFARLKDKGLSSVTGFFEGKCPESADRKDILGYLNDKFSCIQYPDIFDSKTRNRNDKRIEEVYEFLITLMKERIRGEVETGNIEDQDEYTLRQSYFLKKLNVNYRQAIRMCGRRFKKHDVCHDIVYCDDEIGDDDVKRIGGEYFEEISALDREYHRNQMIPQETARKGFFDRIKCRGIKPVSKERDGGHGKSGKRTERTH